MEEMLIGGFKIIATIWIAIELGLGALMPLHDQDPTWKRTAITWSIAAALLFLLHGDY